MGISIVGAAAILYPLKEESGGSKITVSEKIMAISMIVVSLIFNGVLYITEEVFFSKFYVD